MKNIWPNKSKLEYFILKVLEEKYSNAVEIRNKLKKANLKFEEKYFFPVLSHLQLERFLCYNWLFNQEGNPIKYYHITKNGYQYLYSFTNKKIKD